MTPRVVCFGAGGHAKVVIDAMSAGILSGNVDLIGLIARESGSLAGYQVLGSDDDLAAVIAQHRLSHFVVGVGSTRGGTALRKHLFDLARYAGLLPLTVVHPSAIVAEDVSIGAGTVIMAGAVLQPGCTVYENVVLNTRSSVDHDCVVGNHAHIAPGAICCGGVTVGDSAHVGAGATVIQSISIGAGATVAAGAVVIRDCPPGVVVAGVPAR